MKTLRFRIKTTAHKAPQLRDDEIS